MIGSVRGVLRRNQDMQVEIETSGGLGYEISVPSSVAADLPAIGREASLLTHLVMRDGVMELYGFAQQAQRALFRQLISVSGVGPRSALALLSVFEPDSFLAAVIGGDERALTQAPGIGMRTAKRIVVELQDSLSAMAATMPGGLSGDGLRPAAVAALQALSFNAVEANELVRRAEKESTADSTGELVRQALRLAGKRKVQ